MDVSTSAIINSQAAELIDEGRYEEAIVVLRTCIQKSRKRKTEVVIGTNGGNEGSSASVHKKRRVSLAVSEANAHNDMGCHHPQQLEQQQQQQEQRRIECSNHDQHACRQLKDAGTKHVAGNYEETEDENLPFIYQNPIRTNYNNLGENGSVKVYLSMLFNLALASHLKALEEADPVKRQRQLMRTSKLYEFSYFLQLRGSVHLTISQTMALLNNYGHVQQSLNRTASAKVLFQHLLASIMLSIEFGDSESVDELDGFLQTACATILSHTTAAAA